MNSFHHWYEDGRLNQSRNCAVEVGRVVGEILDRMLLCSAGDSIRLTGVVYDPLGG